jgi:hypothetical protein
MHIAKIIKDSLPCLPEDSHILETGSSKSPKRLITWELTYPRIIHGEVMTHRVFSRNSGSSRAIPVAKMIQMTLDNPYIPTYWGKNKSGMQSDGEIGESEKLEATYRWLMARDSAVEHAQHIWSLGVHKETTNRLLEPFMHAQ